MSYEQQNWVTGNRITAEKLNHMEDGIASAGSGGTESLVVLHIEDRRTVETVDEVATTMQSDAAVMFVASFSDAISTHKSYAFATNYINDEPQVIELTLLDGTTSRFTAEPDGHFYLSEG